MDGKTQIGFLAGSGNNMRLRISLFDLRLGGVSNFAVFGSWWIFSGMVYPFILGVSL
jgi:hypothetical protein